VHAGEERGGRDPDRIWQVCATWRRCSVACGGSVGARCSCSPPGPRPGPGRRLSDLVRDAGLGSRAPPTTATRGADRSAIRKAGQVVVTNPDMLRSAILHTTRSGSNCSSVCGSSSSTNPCTAACSATSPACSGGCCGCARTTGATP
jgi:hypothetical protein